MKKTLAAMLTASALALSACGSVTVYETKHTSGKTNISGIKDLFFEKGAAPETVSKTFNDFAIYRSSDGSDELYASVPVTLYDLESNLMITFSADKEFSSWKFGRRSPELSTDDDLKKEADQLYSFYQTLVKEVTDEYGEPTPKTDLANTGHGEITWNISDYGQLTVTSEFPLIFPKKSFSFHDDSSNAYNANFNYLTLTYTVKY